MGLSFLVGILYSINFIFFSSCSVINGDGDCFSLIPNGATIENETYGRGAGTLYVAGALMFGVSSGTLLILNEGARGKWTIMLPTIAGFTCLAIVLAPPFQGDYETANNNPLYATIAALGLYIAAYVMLKEEGVDEGDVVNIKDDGSIFLNQKYFKYTHGLRMINDKRFNIFSWDENYDQITRK